MPDPCDAECTKIITDGGALQGEAAAYVIAAPDKSKIQQECAALFHQLTAEALLAAPLASRYRNNAAKLSGLMGMSQDQCDFADRLRYLRDAGQFGDPLSLRIRLRRLQYHYFLRDLALGEADAVWPPVEYEAIA